MRYLRVFHLRDSLLISPKRRIPLSCISGNIVGKKDTASSDSDRKSTESFPGLATSHSRVFTVIDRSGDLQQHPWLKMLFWVRDGDVPGPRISSWLLGLL